MERQIAQQQIQAFFSSAGPRIYRAQELKILMREHREKWNLQEITATQFVAFLLQNTALRKITLTSKAYPSETRFVWGTVSEYEIALSLKKNSYLSHGTAVFLHSLSDQISATIYVNHEQSPKPRGGALSQASIDRAFKSQQRQSNYIFIHEQKEIVVMNGKYTGRLQVGNSPAPNRRLLPVTSIERTLIDIAVRPAYAGGPSQVLKAYQSARDRLSVTGLVETLKKLDYIYPYHQLVGFYLERAGFEEKRLAQLDKLNQHFDFYATHGIKNQEYSKRWRLFYPYGL